MKEVEAIRVNRKGTVTVRFFTVGVPELELRDIMDAVRKR